MDPQELLKKYPVFQLKSILSKHNREKKLGIKLISKRRKGDVINYLLYHKYNFNDLPNIKKLPATTRTPVTTSHFSGVPPMNGHPSAVV